MAGLGERILRLRTDHGLSQARLAELLGVSRMTIIRWEQGKARPSALAWRRLELAEQAPATPALATRFVGRESELRALDGLLDRAAHGRGRLVLVTGEPGIGKTRLLDELAARASATGWRVLSGRAYDSDGLPPYLPIAEALQEYVRTCPIDTLRTQLGEGARNVGLVVRELARCLPRLEPSPTGASPDDRYFLLQSLVDFVLAIASATPPLLLVFDDMQWADRPTLLWILHLARRLSNTPILVACAHRTVEVGAQPLAEVLADLQRERLAERLLLGPLSQAEATALMVGVLGREPSAEVAQKLWEGTEGTPFFLEELVQHLLAEGQDLTDPHLVLGRWDVPHGVLQVIGKQLRRLSPAALDLLQMAAVLGDGFDFELLSAICGGESTGLLNALDEVLLARLLREASDGYAFAHALIRQAVYEQLSVPRRRERHLRVARAIEQLGTKYRDPDAAVALAAHYRLAGPMADPDKAIEYALRAGEVAATVYAWELAAGHWQGALDLMRAQATDPERRVDLQEKLGRLLLVSRLDLGQAIVALEEALTFWLARGETDRAARVHVAIGRCYLAEPGEHRNIRRGLDHYHAAGAVLERRPPSTDLGWLHLGLAHADSLVLHGDEAMRSASQAIEIGSAFADTALRVEAVARYAAAVFRSGSLAEGLALHERVVAEAEHSRVLAAGFINASNFGALLQRALDPRGAQLVCRRELDKTGRVHPPGVRALLVNLLANAYVRAGEVAAARAVLGAAADAHVWLAYAEGNWERVEARYAENHRRYRRVGDLISQVDLLQGTARLAAVRCDWTAQEQALAESLELLDGGGMLAFDMFSHADLAVLHAHTGRLAEAQKHLALCRAILEGGEDWRGIAGRVGLATALLAAASGRLDAAERGFESALATFRHFSLPFDEAEACELWGKFDAAEAIYRRIGAGPAWLERLARLRGEARPNRRADGLTLRELEVLRLLAAGRTNTEIASALVISIRTVERHIETIYAKVGASGKAARTLAAAYAHRQGLISDSA